uniref:Uncharacterized protein n=1 Tax=Lepeophtheirus salmonis TaxID=72036 RepID=A0A0K2U7R0_LEPSM
MLTIQYLQVRTTSIYNSRYVTKSEESQNMNLKWGVSHKYLHY